MTAALAEPAVTGPATPPNPSGLCMCGCGGTTPLAKRTRYNDGIIAGQHLRYLVGHNSTNRPPCTPDTLTPCPKCKQPMHPDNDLRCTKLHHPGSSAQCRPCSRTGSLAKPRRDVDPFHVIEEWAHFGDVLGYTVERFARMFGYTADGRKVSYSAEGIRKVVSSYAEKYPRDSRVRSFEAAWVREHPLPTDN